MGANPYKSKSIIVHKNIKLWIYSLFFFIQLNWKWSKSNKKRKNLQKSYILDNQKYLSTHVPRKQREKQKKIIIIHSLKLNTTHKFAYRTQYLEGEWEELKQEGDIRLACKEAWNESIQRERLVRFFNKPCNLPLSPLSLSLQNGSVDWSVDSKARERRQRQIEKMTQVTPKRVHWKRVMNISNSMPKKTLL